MTWWRDLGRTSGHPGSFSAHRVKCAFCGSSGAFKKAFDAIRNLELGLELHSQVFECNECGNYTFVMWGSTQGARLHDFVQFPVPTAPTAPEYWPEQIRSAFVQAKKAIESESWDAAAVMAGRAVQATIRHLSGTSQGKLVEEIRGLTANQILPKGMADWADEVRALRNIGAHPDAKDTVVSPEDAKDIVQFAYYFVLYAVDIPYRIERYKRRDKPAQPSA